VRPRPCQIGEALLDDEIVDEVTPNELAKALGVTGLQFRNWLRDQKARGHPLLATHEYRTRYRFTRAEADELAAECRGDTTRDDVRRTSPAVGPRRVARRSQPLAIASVGSQAGHRVIETWRGEDVETLADLLRPGLRAVVVGINPSPVSVAVGHYYQGRLGQRFFKRIAEARLVDLSVDGFEDDAAYAAGIGFTDVVKRPTARADSLRPDELEHGRALLEPKLSVLAVPRVLFTFKASAEALLGPLTRPGLQAGRSLADAEVFVMPGPMARTDVVQSTLGQLRDWWENA
jgi:double-stranded uracil-DNA glycosylase